MSMLAERLLFGTSDFRLGSISVSQLSRRAAPRESGTRRRRDPLRRSHDAPLIDERLCTSFGRSEPYRTPREGGEGGRASYFPV